MSQTNKELVRAFYEAIDSGNTTRVGQMCAPNATFQFGGAPAISADAFTQMLAGFGAGSSRHVVRDLIAEGDKVACHVDVVSKAVDGASSTKALTLFTLADGRVVSELVILDRGMAG